MDEKVIIEEVRNCFIARNEGTIDEKISYFTRKGVTEDKARHAITQIVKNLPNDLLPLKIIPKITDGFFLQGDDIIKFEEVSKHWEQL